MSKGLHQLIADLHLLPAFNQTERARVLEIFEILILRIDLLEDRIEQLEKK